MVDKVVSVPETQPVMRGIICTFIMLVCCSPLSKGQVSPETAKAAERLIHEGKFLEAETVYLSILKEHPGSLLALSNLGIVYYQQGQFQKAITMLNQALKLAPTDGFSHRTLGLCYLKTDELDLAKASLEQAIKLNPKDARAHNFMSILATQKGWWSTAKFECERAIELDKNYANAYFNLAVIHASQDPPRKALGIKAYRKSLDLGGERSRNIEQQLGLEF